MPETLVDYITGKTVPNQGPEETRQRVERFLVEEKGYLKEDIRVDEPITVLFQGEPYEATIDLVVFFSGKAFMALKCVAGSIGSYEREILSGARLLYDYQIPFSVSTDSRNALVRNGVTGKPAGEGLQSIPSKSDALAMEKSLQYTPLEQNKKEREMILFRSYNMNRERGA